MSEETVTELKRKIKRTGTQFGWSGVSLAFVGVILTAIGAGIAEFVLTLGSLVAIQGVVIGYIFKS